MWLTIHFENPWVLIASNDWQQYYVNKITISLVSAKAIVSFKNSTHKSLSSLHQTYIWSWHNYKSILAQGSILVAITIAMHILFTFHLVWNGISEVCFNKIMVISSPKATQFRHKGLIPQFPWINPLKHKTSYIEKRKNCHSDWYN